jgi:hypothetical protein
MPATPPLPGPVGMFQPSCRAFRLLEINSLESTPKTWSGNAGGGKTVFVPCPTEVNRFALLLILIVC